MAKHFYTKFLPEVLELAERKGRGEEWRAKIEALRRRDEHVWLEGLTPDEARALGDAYQRRYGEIIQPSRSTPAARVSRVSGAPTVK